MTGRDHVDPVVPDITAVRRDDDLLSALSTQRALSAQRVVDARADDEAIRLLRALIADIDVDAPPLPVTVRSAAKPAPRTRPGRRRKARAVVSFGLAALMLTTTGVAAASGGVGAEVSRLVTAPKADRDRPYRDSRADLERAEKAMDSRQYDTARASLEKARHKRGSLHGSAASHVDKEIGKLESRLPRPPSPFPRPWLVPPSPRAGESDELARAARSAAEQRLRGAQHEWHGPAVLDQR